MGCVCLGKLPERARAKPQYRGLGKESQGQSEWSGLAWGWRCSDAAQGSAGQSKADRTRAESRAERRAARRSTSRLTKEKKARKENGRCGEVRRVSSRTQTGRVRRGRCGPVWFRLRTPSICLGFKVLGVWPPSEFGGGSAQTHTGAKVGKRTVRLALRSDDEVGIVCPVTGVVSCEATRGGLRSSRSRTKKRERQNTTAALTSNCR